MRVVGIIPSRIGSTRLPGKPLVDIHGLPMIVHVCIRAKLCKELDDVYVATDSFEIAETVSRFGFKYVMTDSSHTTGTDRIAEAVSDIECDVVVNIQGDEALVEPDSISLVVNAMYDPTVNVALLVTKCAQYNTPSHVKVVFNSDMNVMYFSRSDIPSSARTRDAPMFKGYHIVPFRKDFLLKFSGWESSRLEEIEYCEYMRIIERGYDIKCVYVDSEAVSVDDDETLLYVRNKMVSDQLFRSYAYLASVK